MVKKQYERLRFDSGHHRRILLTMCLLGIAAFVPVMLRLYHLMVGSYDYYADLALRNQTRTTRIEAERGEIYDRNMNVLATSVGVENVYLDPHELKQSKADVPALAQVLGKILNKDQQWIEEQAKDFGHSFERETGYLTVHSMLHLLGYDHMVEEDKKIMREKEEEILSKIGLVRD